MEYMSCAEAADRWAFQKGGTEIRQWAMKGEMAMGKCRIMVVEDDLVIREELVLLLKNEGYQVLPVIDFSTIPNQAVRETADLILLDIGLPGQDGFALCARLRKAVSVPIIFVTSRDSGLDEVRALSLGGDDYITKPYNVPVLMARIKAVLRRSGATSECTDVMEAAGVRLSLTKGILMSEEKTVEIMVCLMEHTGQIVSRADLLDALWDNQVYIDDNTLSVNMTRLRGKLAELDRPDLIRTRRGMGYQL